MVNNTTNINKPNIQRIPLTLTSHLDSLNKDQEIYDIGNPGAGLEQATKKQHIVGLNWLMGSQRHM